MLEVKALLNDGIEGLEQAFLEGKGQGYGQVDLPTVHTLQLGFGEDLPGQALGAVLTEQGFLIQTDALAVAGACHYRRRPTFAVGDRTTDACRPDRRTVLVGAGDVLATIQALQRSACTHPPGEVFGLALGHRALQVGCLLDAGAGEVVTGQLGRVERTADQHRTGYRAG
ncbi:hypothetical protein D3C77_476630 [compost metagenome]